jgi:hypothetical protein
MRITSGGIIKFNNVYCFPTADGSASQYLCTDGSGALSFAAVADVVCAGDDLCWISSVETGTDENALKVIFVDLDDPLQLWDYSVFMQQIQDTSWHDELGDPPVHGLMWITEDQGSLIWWNRETQAIYMQFDKGAASNTFLAHNSASVQDLYFLDGVIYAGNTIALRIIDLMADTGYSYTTGGKQLIAGDVSTRNTDSVAITVYDAGIAIVNNAVQAIGAVRDPDLTDEFGRSKHWWAAGTAAGQSVYSPVCDAIYDQGTGDNTGTLISRDGVLIQAVDTTNSWWQVRRSIFSVTADSYGYDAYLSSANYVPSGLSLTNSGRQAILLEDTSWASAAMPQYWQATDAGGIFIWHTTPTDNDGDYDDRGIIRLNEAYASPYMKGDTRGAYPLHAVTDVSSNGNDLTNNGSVPFSSGGPAGSYGSFDGAGQDLTLSYTFDPGLTEWRVQGWFKSSSATYPGGQENLISVWDSVSAHFIQLAWTGDTSWIFDYGISLSAAQLNRRTFAGDVYDGNWHHVLFQRVGSLGTTADITEIWIDAVLVNSTPIYNVPSTAATLDRFAIGTDSGGTADFTGDIGGVEWGIGSLSEHEVKAGYARGVRRINSTIDANDTISDNDIAAIAGDPAGNYVAVMGVDKVVQIFDQFAVPVASDTYPGTTARDAAINTMPGGTDPHYIMAGSDQIEIVQPNTRIT